MSGILDYSYTSGMGGCQFLVGLLSTLMAATVTITVSWITRRLTHNQTADSHNAFATLVSTSSGSIRGHVIESTAGSSVVEYLGIPYAKPPVGELRFKDPQKYEQLPEKFNASTMGASCIQVKQEDEFDSEVWTPKNKASEDCLTINVWVPQSKKKVLSTMVWVYGGGFYSGSSALPIYNGSTLASYGEVIVVTFNYRVGVLGFLSTGDQNIPGNFGLKDQALALKWVHDNIESFGGSLDSVTLFGESSGASSIGYHLMSSTDSSSITDHEWTCSKYFQRVILQSGVPQCPWAFREPKKAQESAKQFIKDVSCDQTSDVLSCLQSLDVSTILENEWQNKGFLSFPWVPTVDGLLVKHDPNEVSNLKIDKEIMTGLTCQEGAIWLTSLPGISLESESLQTAEQFRSAIKTVISDVPKDKQDWVKGAYIPRDVDNEEANRDNLDYLSGDRSFTCPCLNFLTTVLQNEKKHQSQQDVNKVSSSSTQNTGRYLYRFCHKASIQYTNDWVKAVHGDEIQWVFGMPLDKSLGYSADEIKLSRIMMSYWASFAETGNPNIGNLVVWDPYTLEQRQHLDINEADDIKMSTKGFRNVLCQMWHEIDGLYKP